MLTLNWADALIGAPLFLFINFGNPLAHIYSDYSYMSCFCICINKEADRYIDSTIPKVQFQACCHLLWLYSRVCV